MKEFKAIAHESIPLNRLTVLTVQGKTEENDKIRIRLAQEGEYPDFVSKRNLKEGEEVTVVVVGANTWTAEAAEDIRAGVQITSTDGGKVKEAVADGSPSPIGYSLHAAKADETVEYVRNGGGTQGPKGPKGDKGDPGEKGPAGQKGDKGDPGFGTEEQYNDIIERLEALEGGES